MPIVGIPSMVVAIYATDSGQTIPHGSKTIVNFDTKFIDTHDAVTTGAAWKFTVPISGLYFLRANALYVDSSDWSAGEIGQLEVNVNGAATRLINRIDMYTVEVATAMFLSGSCLIAMDANDALDLRIYQSSGESLNLLAATLHNRVSIVKYVGA